VHVCHNKSYDWHDYTICVCNVNDIIVWISTSKVAFVKFVRYYNRANLAIIRNALLFTRAADRLIFLIAINRAIKKINGD